LPTTTTLPILKTSYAKYADAFMAGYSVTPISPTAAVDSPLPAAAKPWLYLTQTGVDFTLFGQSCMVSVNGYFHYMQTDTTGAYIRDGMVSNLLSKNNQIGIYNLGHLGSLTYVDLTPSMIYNPNVGGLLADAVYIDVGQDITDKTIILVLGGYLHVLDERTFVKVGTQQIKVDWVNFPYIDRYFESEGTLDLSSLGLTHIKQNVTQVAVSELLGNAAITAYCSLSQSFIVLLDNTEVFRDSHFVKSRLWPGQYTSYVAPEYPLIVGHGRVAEYWYQYEHKQWGLSVRNGMMDNRVYYTTDPKKQRSIAANRTPARPQRISPAQFLMLGTDVQQL
jgi:hypothetical protein